jgi:predicted nucleic acid-binding protein
VEKRPSLYLETSFISYLTARTARTIIGSAYQQLSLDWWQTQRHLFDLKCSKLVIDECSQGDSTAVAKRLAVLRGIPLLASNEQVLSLARELLAQKLLPPNSLDDAIHIALAAVHGIEYILTLNFKHIANPMMKDRIGNFLQQQGFLLPHLCGPDNLLGVSDGRF